MKPDPKKKYKKTKINWDGFAVPKQSIKLSPHKYLKLKRKVHELDGWKCVNPDCKHTYSREELTFHHIIPVGRIRLDTVDNGMTLCLWCHMLVEDKLLYLDFKELLKKRKDLTR